MAYPEKMSRIEEEMCEDYARFRIDSCSREDTIRYMMLMKYELTPRVIQEIKLNDKHIFGL